MKKTVLITGASGGLGKEMAKILKNEYQVVILSSNLENLQKTANELKVEYFLCDITDFNQCQKTVKEIIRKFGKIDVLINNAGVWLEGELNDNDYLKIKKTVEVNLLGQIFMTKVVIPFMKEQKSGTIIFINSVAGLESKAKRSVYTSTKWGLKGFADSLNKELRDFNIKIISIFPGKMKTKLFEKAGIKKDLLDAFDSIHTARLIEFILKMPDDVLIFYGGIKNINQ